LRGALTHLQKDGRKMKCISKTSQNNKLSRTKANTPLNIGHKIYIIEAFEQHLNNILGKEIELE